MIIARCKKQSAGGDVLNAKEGETIMVKTKKSSRIIDQINNALKYYGGIATFQEITEYFIKEELGATQQEIGSNLSNYSKGDHPTIYKLAKGLWGLSHLKDVQRSIVFYRVLDMESFRKRLQEKSLPCFTITPAHTMLVTGRDVTNDDGFFTTYILTYFPDANSKDIDVGEVKILLQGQQPNEKVTKSLPEVFTRLTEKFCSLGQTDKYYQFFAQSNDTIFAENALKALRDVTFDPEIQKQFATEDGFTKSLLRLSSAQANLELGWKQISANKSLSTGNLSFTFRCRLSEKTANETDEDDDAQSHIIDFDFSPLDSEMKFPDLNRIMVLIGANGTGKTKVLAKLAQAISGINRDAGSFSHVVPKFRMVIAVAYSVFDNFDVPVGANRVFNYVYCGIRSDAKGDPMGTGEAGKRLAKAALLLINRPSAEEYFEFWKNVMSKILPSYVAIPEMAFKTGRDIREQDQDFQEKISAFYNELSSGQRAMVLIFTEVIANIERESIILFDEPELHQHPAALSALLSALGEILRKFNSYAVIATHSPLVLQEIPSQYVRIINRDDHYIRVTHLNFESLGESLDGIVDLVFGFPDIHNNYRGILTQLGERYSQDEILDIFHHRLSLQARMFLANNELSNKQKTRSV